MMDDWHDYSGSFVEQFHFNKSDSQALKEILEPKNALHVIDRVSSLVEVQREQDKYYDNDPKDILLSKLAKIENGLKKSIETMGTLDRTAKDLLPKYMYYQELELTKCRNDIKLTPNFDPRDEILITLNAIKELKSHVGKPSKLPISFALQIFEIWCDYVVKIDSERLQMSYPPDKTKDEIAFTEFAAIALRNIKYVAEDLSYLYKRAFQEKNRKNS